MSLIFIQDFIPVVDVVTRKVLHIDFPAHYSYVDQEEKEHKLSATTTAPHPLDVTALDHSNRERILPPAQRFDFLPDLITEDDKNFKLRDDLKPLHIVQPEGVSFKMNGHELEWQKWKMHICEYGYSLEWYMKITLNPSQRSIIEKGLHSQQSHTMTMVSPGRYFTAFPWRKWSFRMQHPNTPTHASSHSICESHSPLLLFPLSTSLIGSVASMDWGQWRMNSRLDAIA